VREFLREFLKKHGSRRHGAAEGKSRTLVSRLVLPPPRSEAARGRQGLAEEKCTGKFPAAGNFAGNFENKCTWRRGDCGPIQPACAGGDTTYRKIPSVREFLREFFKRGGREFYKKLHVPTIAIAHLCLTGLASIKHAVMFG
jgi:hypothetical protein